MLWMLALRAAPMRRALLLTDQAPGWLRSPFRMLRLLKERRALAAALAARADGGASGSGGGNGARRHPGLRRLGPGQPRHRRRASVPQRPTLAEALDATQGEQLRAGRALWLGKALTPTLVVHSG